jgi:hypothetical protein
MSRSSPLETEEHEREQVLSATEARAGRPVKGGAIRRILVNSLLLAAVALLAVFLWYQF